VGRLRNKATGSIVNVPEDSLEGYEPVEPEPKKAPAKRASQKSDDGK
jgi:hypothetical protein